MRKQSTLLTLFILLIYGASAQNIPSAPFFGFKGNSSEPVILLPNVVSTNSLETNGTFSPDGRMFLYTVQFLHSGPIIAFMQLKENGWTSPEISSFSGTYRDIDPVFSPDGKRVYFNSSRPINEARADEQDMNIWFTELAETGFGAPKPLSLTVNTSAQPYYVSVSKKGALYFHSKDAQTGSLAIYKASRQGQKYSVEPLGSAINSQNAADPFISPLEDYIIFASNRPGGFGSNDLYISFATEKGWSTPVNLGEKINSDANEYAPSVSPDGKILTFTSNRMIAYWNTSHKKNYTTLLNKINSPDNELDNIWWVSTDFIQELKKQFTVSSLKE